MKLILCLLTFILPFQLIGNEQRKMQEGYISVDGGKIYYRSIGKGEPIFIIHGGPGLDHTYLLPGMDALADKYQLIYYDQRGTGRSVAPLNCESINMDSFVEDIDSLRKALNYEKITLLGHSWGGLVALEYTMKHASNVDALILMHSVPPYTKGMERFYENLDVRLKPISESLAAIEASEEFKERNPGIISRYVKAILHTYFWDEAKGNLLNVDLSKETAANFFIVGGLIDSDYLGDYDIRQEIAKISVPTLVIHGDVDPIPEKYAQEMHELIKGSEYLLIAHAGHYPYIEQPFALFRGIQGFLGKNLQ